MTAATIEPFEVHVPDAVLYDVLINFLHVPGRGAPWMYEYCNVQMVETSAHGGYFAAAEQPALVVDHLRTFFRHRRDEEN